MEAAGIEPVAWRFWRERRTDTSVRVWYATARRWHATGRSRILGFMGSKPTEAAEHDAGVFLERMRRAVSAFGPVRVRELACEIAQRYVDDLGEDAGSARALLQEAHTLAATQPISQAQFEEWAGLLNGMSANVDPDRLGAADAWRALRMLELALRACTEGPPAGAGPFDVVCASLAGRALCQPPANEAEQQSLRETLQQRWLWKGVQQEARWLAAYVEREG
jgi:hypothetical protein